LRAERMRKAREKIQVKISEEKKREADRADEEFARMLNERER